MSTWEERMSARAHARARDQAAVEAVVNQAEEITRQSADEQRMAAELVAAREAGPPTACPTCWTFFDGLPGGVSSVTLGPDGVSDEWSRTFWQVPPGWEHVGVREEPWRCSCACHGDGGLVVPAAVPIA